MADTFTWIPEFGVTKTKKPVVSNIQFGDGYMQRAAYGMNTNPETWPLTFANRTTADADAIEGFLDNCAGVTAFLWTPPLESTPKLYICQEYTRSPQKGDYVTLSANFVQVFEPTG